MAEKIERRVLKAGPIPGEAEYMKWIREEMPEVHLSDDPEENKRLHAEAMAEAEEEADEDDETD